MREPWLNFRLADAAARRSAEDVLDELDASYEALRAELERLTPSQLAAEDGWARHVVSGNSFDHYAEHRNELMTAVPRTSRELRAKVEAGWRRFRDLVAGADLERTTSAGWTG